MRTGIEKRDAAFTAAALVIPTVEAAAGKNWLPVVMEAVAAWLICCWLSVEEGEVPYWLKSLRCIAGILISGWLLGLTAKPWQGEMAEYVVPAILLILSAVSAGKGAAQAQTAVNVLRYGIYAVMILLLVAGVREIAWETVRPKAELPDMTLGTIMLLPLMKKCSKRGVSLAAAAILASILTAGSSGIYEYSRGISIPGVADHLESMAAAIMTVGYYGMLSFLMMHFGGVETKGNALKTLATYIVYCIGIVLEPWVYAASLIMLWGIIPLLTEAKRKRKKYEKSA